MYETLGEKLLDPQMNHIIPYFQSDTHPTRRFDKDRDLINKDWQCDGVFYIIFYYLTQ